MLFAIPEVLQVPILTEWLGIKQIGRLLSAACNKKLRADLLKLLALDHCSFDAEVLTECWRSPNRMDRLIKLGVKVRQLCLEGTDLEDNSRRKVILRHFGPALHTLGIDLVKHNGRYIPDDSDYYDSTSEEEDDRPAEFLNFDMSALFEDIKLFCPHLQHLRFERCRESECLLPNDDYASAIHYIATHTTLRSICLNYFGVVPDKILQAICQSPSLHTVDFSTSTFELNAATRAFMYCNLTVQTLTVQNVRVCALFPNITTLTMYEVNASEFTLLAQGCVHVRFAELHYDTEEHGAITTQMIEDMGNHWTQLNVLKLYDSEITEAQLLHLIAVNSALTQLHTVAHHPEIEMVTFPKMVEPADGSGSQLRVLETYCDRAETLRAITTRCVNLHTLSLTQGRNTIAQLGDVTSMTEALHCLHKSNVQCLYLRNYNALGDDTLLMLSHHRTIRTLHISYVAAITNAAVLKLLPTLPALHTLNLEHCVKLDRSIVMQVPALCSTLRSFTYLHYQHCDCGCSTLLIPLLLRVFPHVTFFDVWC